jgi:hypothetical protein
MSFKPSSRPATQKLGIDARTRLLLLGSPLPVSIAIDGIVVAGDADVVLITCADAQDVSDNLETGLARRRPDGRLWLAYRKGDPEFTRTHLSAAVDSLHLDLTWFRQASLGGEWTAIWFKRRTEFRKLNH